MAARAVRRWSTRWRNTSSAKIRSTSIVLFEKMRRARLFDGAMAGATVTAMTGIEIALWDLAGKALGVPVYQLLGGKFRDTVRLYCDSHAGKSFAPAAYAERAQEVVALGFDAIKFDVDETQAGFRTDRWNWHASNAELDWMVERVAAVREAVGPNDRSGDRHARALRHRERDRRRAGDGAVRIALAGGAGAARKRGGDA